MAKARGSSEDSGTYPRSKGRALTWKATIMVGYYPCRSLSTRSRIPCLALVIHILNILIPYNVLPFRAETQIKSHSWDVFVSRGEIWFPNSDIFCCEWCDCCDCPLFRIRGLTMSAKPKTRPGYGWELWHECAPIQFNTDFKISTPRYYFAQFYFRKCTKIDTFARWKSSRKHHHLPLTKQNWTCVVCGSTLQLWIEECWEFSWILFRGIVILLSDQTLCCGVLGSTDGGVIQGYWIFGRQDVAIASSQAQKRRNINIKGDTSYQLHTP